MSNIFVTGPRLRWSFFLWGQTIFINPFWGFLSTFSNFSSKGNLKKATRGAAGNKFSGVIPPLFPWNCLGQFPGWVCLARHLIRLIFGFFNFSFFFAHAKDEMRKLTRRVQTRPMRFFFNQRGLVRDRGDYCLPAVVPLSGYLIFSSSSKIWRDRQ